MTEFSFLRHFLVFTLLLGFHLCTSQQMEIQSKWEVRLDGKVLDYRNIDSLFQFDQETYQLYHKSITSFKKAKTTGLVSLGSAGIGMAAILLDNNPPNRYCDTFCFTTGDVIGALLIATVFPISGTAGLITLGKGIKRQKMVVQSYNEHFSPDIGTSFQPTLSFGFTNNGVGLVLQF